MPRSIPPLINPTWDEMVAREPLAAFSWYLSGRKNVLLEISDEILVNLDTGFQETKVDMGLVERAEMLMWLWILGAYEVIRTMHQARSCFSSRVQVPLESLKLRLATVRMPAAKMEKRGKRSPVPSQRSPSAFDTVKKDLSVGDPSDQTFSARELLAEFRRFINSLEPGDILQIHENSYRGSTESQADRE